MATISCVSVEGTAADESTTLSGMRVAILVHGTRGDAQPYLALGLQLQKEGCIVSIMTNCNHGKFVRDQGLDCVEVFYDTEDALKQPDLLGAMKHGKTFDFLKAMGKRDKETFSADFDSTWAALSAFKPDLVLYGALSAAQAELYGAIYKVPAIPVFLGIYLLTGEVAPLGLPSTFAWANRFLWKAVAKKMNKDAQGKLRVAKKKLGQSEMEDLVLVSNLNEFIENCNEPVCPKIHGVSAHVYGPPKDVTSPNIYATGWWILDSTHQVERFQAGDPAFGGDEKDRIEAFLKGAPAPVYIGWGSMIAVSPEHMTKLAVATLQQTKQRGIVLQGWSGLGPALLHDEGLEAFAKENVLFIKAAPHEWLLPQCSVSIIHGGSGTTAAALRAGRPTIITPVFMDQYDFASSVSRLNVGVATCQFKHVTPGILAAAVNKCLTDEKVLENVQALSKQLRHEDGVGQAVEVLKTFVNGPLRNGDWMNAVNARNTRWKIARSQGVFGLFRRSRRSSCKVQDMNC